MFRFEVTGSLDLAQLAAQTRPEVLSAVERGTGRARDLAKLNITSAGRVDTGQLRNSVESMTEVRGSEIVGTVGTGVDHATYVHEGTQGPIYPRSARVLRFVPKGGRAYVFAPSVAGIDATPFLSNARDALTLSDFL